MHRDILFIRFLKFFPAALLILGLFSASMLMAQLQPVPASRPTQTTRVLGMLYPSGEVQVNGAVVPDPTALWNNDVIQTGTGVANFTMQGTVIVLEKNTKIRLEDVSINVEAGEVRVMTFENEVVHAGDVTIKPLSGGVSENATTYTVRHANGKVFISANKHDVAVEACLRTVTLQEGHTGTRDDRHKCKAGAAPGGSGGVLDSTTAKAIGTAAVGTIILWNLDQSGAPISPSKP